MLDQVVAAFDRKDYRTAARLLKELLKKAPNDPWVQFYLARIQEVSGKLESAEKIYRQLLRETTSPRLATQARQGVQRVEDLVHENRRQAIAQATAESGIGEPGVLILEAVAAEEKSAVAKGLAKVTKLDAYTARLHLPSRGWRFYRTGMVGELRVYAQELQAAGVPAFCVALADVEKIPVFRVQYFQAVNPQAIVVCLNDADQLGSISFQWSEVSQRVVGLIPVFEKVVDLDVRKKLQRKEETLDYIHFCDLHLPERRCILRLHDIGYQFQQGVDFSPEPIGSTETTIRRQWNYLMNFLQSELPQMPVWNEFTPFAETAVDQTEVLSTLKPHINLFRQVESDWDPAFHLYSGCAFLLQQGNGKGS